MRFNRCVGEIFVFFIFLLHVYYLFFEYRIGWYSLLFLHLCGCEPRSSWLLHYLLGPSFWITWEIVACLIGVSSGFFIMCFCSIWELRYWDLYCFLLFYVNSSSLYMWHQVDRLDFRIVTFKPLFLYIVSLLLFILNFSFFTSFHWLGWLVLVD